MPASEASQPACTCDECIDYEATLPPPPDLPEPMPQRWADSWTEVVPLPTPWSTRSPGEELADAAPGPELASLLQALGDTGALTEWARLPGRHVRGQDAALAELRLGVLQGWDTLASWVNAQRDTALHAAHEALAALDAPPEDAPRWSSRDSAPAEIALALRIPTRSINAHLDRAERLLTVHPGTLWLLDAGLISYAHASAVVNECAVLDDAGMLAAVEAAVLARAPESTAANLRRAVRRAIARIDPEGDAERVTEAATETVGVWKRNLDVAQVMITAVLPAPAGYQVMGALDSIVDAFLSPSEDGTRDDDGAASPGRSRRSLRADALTLLASALADQSILPDLPRSVPEAPAINVTISVDALLGLSDNPGELAGYGTIPAELARTLAADGTWARFLLDPRTGALLDATPHRYRPGTRTRAFVGHRDRHCRFPGCRTRVELCDLDHIEPFDHRHPPDGGPTTCANLACLCRRHHNHKTWYGWHTTRGDDGSIVFRTPLGRAYVSAAPDLR